MCYLPVLSYQSTISLTILMKNTRIQSELIWQLQAELFVFVECDASRRCRYTMCLSHPPYTMVFVFSYPHTHTHSILPKDRLVIKPPALPTEPHSTPNKSNCTPSCMCSTGDLPFEKCFKCFILGKNIGSCSFFYCSMWKHTKGLWEQPVLGEFNEVEKKN